MIHLILTVTFSSADCKRHVTSASAPLQAPTFDIYSVLQCAAGGDGLAFAEVALAALYLPDVLTVPVLAFGLLAALSVWIYSVWNA